MSSIRPTAAKTWWANERIINPGKWNITRKMVIQKALRSPRPGPWFFQGPAPTKESCTYLQDAVTNKHSTTRHREAHNSDTTKQTEARPRHTKMINMCPYSFRFFSDFFTFFPLLLSLLPFACASVLYKHQELQKGQGTKHQSQRDSDKGREQKRYPTYYRDFFAAVFGLHWLKTRNQAQRNPKPVKPRDNQH